jgi:hypothetical protein
MTTSLARLSAKRVEHANIAWRNSDMQEYHNLFILCRLQERDRGRGFERVVYNAPGPDRSDDQVEKLGSVFGRQINTFMRGWCECTNTPQAV